MVAQWWLHDHVGGRKYDSSDSDSDSEEGGGRLWLDSRVLRFLSWGVCWAYYVRMAGSGAGRYTGREWKTGGPVTVEEQKA